MGSSTCDRRTGAIALAVIVAALFATCGGDEGADPPNMSDVSEGWTLTVYYTAVEEHHDGPPVAVVGCDELDCVDGDADLGAYPADFVEAVEAEGTGRITDGPHAGECLNWSYDVGFWLDSVPRDSHGRQLEPFVTAAADADVLAEGRAVTITDCGKLEEGGVVPDDVCRQLQDADWVVGDEFTPGLGGERHVDLYVGEETSPTFTDSTLYTTLVEAQLLVDPNP